VGIPGISPTRGGGIRLASVWDVARPSAGYQPRSPSESVLYQIVRDHLEIFRTHAARVCEGERLPRFIVDEFEAFLRCGSLAGGFARFRCDGCGLDRLVPFSCKGRAVCPSCGAGGWPSAPRIWSITCSRRCLFASGC
jgi:Transposase zinc-binding domain